MTAPRLNSAIAYFQPDGRPTLEGQKLFASVASAIDAGGSGDSAISWYLHEQTTPAAIWTIDHNLGRPCGAVCYDAGGTRIHGGEAQPTLNRLTITFSTAVAGSARVI